MFFTPVHPNGHMELEFEWRSQYSQWYELKSQDKRTLKSVVSQSDLKEIDILILYLLSI
jgi:hypothetical protein